MSARKPHRLESLFDFYSADLARFTPSLSGAFGCPLCHAVIRRVDDLRQVVAEEHIVPKALGGRLTTLTCRSCNTAHGSTLDAHLIQRVRVEARKRPVAARMAIGDGEQGIELYLPKADEDPFELVVVREQSDPRGIEASMEALKSGTPPTIHLHATFGYNKNRSVVGLLRAAYLLMFRYFGYRYILDPSAKPVHWQIQNPIEASAVLNGVQWHNKDSLPVENAVGVVQSPKRHQCFAVILQLDAETQHRAILLLPQPGDDGARLYAQLETTSTPWQYRVTCFGIPKVEFLPFLPVWQDYTRRATGTKRRQRGKGTKK